MFDKCRVEGSCAVLVVAVLEGKERWRGRAVNSKDWVRGVNEALLITAVAIRGAFTVPHM